jgi:hypothetical protein
MALTLVKSAWESGRLVFRKAADNAFVQAIGASGFESTNVGTQVDVDAQNADLLAATLATGLLVHTSVTGGGTLTVDTAANLDSAFPEWQIGEVRTCHYVNDGNQTVTLTGSTGTTRLAATTIATLQGRRICVQKTAASTYITWAE